MANLKNVASEVECPAAIAAFTERILEVCYRSSIITTMTECHRPTEANGIHDFVFERDDCILSAMLY